MPEFSTPALHAIEQTVELSATEESTSTHLPLHEAYEIDSTVSEILSNGYRTIALQFPDELLNQSVLMYRALMLGLKRGGAGEDVQCYVLGDSTYGS
jgi:diphthamide biosynthesis protein 2